MTHKQGQCILVCGGRDYDNMGKVREVLDELNPSLVIHGAARGADQLAQHWCDYNHVDFLQFPADWKRHGKAAGPLRNAKMLRYGKPGLVVAFPGGRGTANMVKLALEADVPVLVIE